jgi:D-sedoheptulose 7-phosphate isomerase
MQIGVQRTGTESRCTEGEEYMSNRPNAAGVFGAAIAEHMEVVRQVESQQPVLEAIARAMVSALRAGGKILWCGNGGSAGDSQHLASELVGRYRRERRGMASVALTTDSSALTSIANDCGFEAVFSRQVEALGVEGDLLVGISTSGNSQNVVAALEAARRQGMATVAFTGAGGGRMVKLADHLFAVASKETARIQEAHILAGHMLCDWIEMDCVSGAERASAVVLEIAATAQVEGGR